MSEPASEPVGEPASVNKWIMTQCMNNRVWTSKWTNEWTKKWSSNYEHEWTSSIVAPRTSECALLHEPATELAKWTSKYELLSEPASEWTTEWTSDIEVALGTSEWTSEWTSEYDKWLHGWVVTSSTEHQASVSHHTGSVTFNSPAHKLTSIRPRAPIYIFIIILKIGAKNRSSVFILWVSFVYNVIRLRMHACC